MYKRQANGSATAVVKNQPWQAHVTWEKRDALTGGRITEDAEYEIQEWNPEKGRAIDADDMNAAMAVLKANNINAVRTCHYPDQSLWYDLCDRNGIYMIDETNLESHGSWQKLGAVEPSWNVPGSLPEWKDCVVDRARSMFERDKNHPCVIIWSLGNETGSGCNFQATYAWIHAHDRSQRPVHSEDSGKNRPFTDIFCPMYKKIDVLINHALYLPTMPLLSLIHISEPARRS